MYRGDNQSVREDELKQLQSTGDRSNAYSNHFKPHRPWLKGLSILLGIVLFIMIVYFLSILLFRFVGL